MQRKIWFRQLSQFAAMGLLLFSGAGTLNWPAGWSFLALYALITTAMSLRLAKVDPGLLEERIKFGPQDDQPLWDRIVLKLLGGLILAWLIVPGLDSVRFGWSSVSLWLQTAGGVLFVTSLGAIYLVMRQNSYLAPTVYVQRERGHTLISSGAYGIVRHPFYSLLIPFFTAGSLLLGSWWGVAVSGLIALLLAYRCRKEEQHLTRELEGYLEYTEQVRYRVVPYVW